MNTPSYMTVELLKRAKAEVAASPLYKRFISGTPLENDIAVWMADFAGQVLHEAEASPPVADRQPDEEMAPHPFHSRTLYEPGDDRDIWCADCEYHRDHQIYTAPVADRPTTFDWLPAVEARYASAMTRAAKSWPQESTIDSRIVSALKDIPQLLAEVRRLRLSVPPVADRPTLHELAEGLRLKAEAEEPK